MYITQDDENIHPPTSFIRVHIYGGIATDMGKKLNKVKDFRSLIRNWKSTVGIIFKFHRQLKGVVYSSMHFHPLKLIYYASPKISKKVIN